MLPRPFRPSPRPGRLALAVALGVALYTLNASRNSAQKLGEEVMRLKREVEALKAGGFVAPAEGEVAREEAAETVQDAPAGEDFASPWASAQAAGQAI